MNFQPESGFTKPLAGVVLALCCAGLTPLQAAEPATANRDEFAAEAAAVVRLLETGDAAEFARALTPSLADWRSVASGNREVGGEDPLGPAWQEMLDRQRGKLEEEARRLLERAGSLHVDFTKLKLTGRAAPPKSLGTTRHPGVQAEGESLGWTAKLDIEVTAAAKAGSADVGRMEGDYRVSLSNLIKFPSGWRCQEGIRWGAFPPAVLNDQTRLEMAILERAAAYKGINQDDDPTLLQLGEALARFVRTADATVFETDAMLTFDAVWSMFQALAGGQAGAVPTREQLEEHWAVQRKVILEPAQAMVEFMKTHGIKLQAAEIELKQVALNRLTARGGAGSLEGLDGSQLTVLLTVKTTERSRSGADLSGDYVVAVEEALRIGGRWYVARPVRWEKLPAGVVDEQVLAGLEFERYVAEHGSLPPGTAAPDIEFVTVDGGQAVQLKELRGKVVILDFWATWCGPCQEPMAKMQKYREQNPGWGDRVAVVSLSIDETLQAVRQHVDQRGWTNTFNVWAGDGAWQSAPARAFRLRGVPTCYIIDQQGAITQVVHPSVMDVPAMVNRLLK
jgi:thiol-disulfide isomerase/thioredoxin